MAMQPEEQSDDEKNASQQPSREVESRRSDTFLSLYANSVNIRLTPWDVQLIFGEILEADERKLVIENHLAVTLSPQHAKALLNALSGQVQAYERQFGEIRYTPVQPKTEQPSA